MKNLYYVLGRYQSKYGVILYCIKVTGVPENFAFDLKDCYIHTLYFKGSNVPEITTMVEMQTFKGENGLTYAVI